MSPARLLVLLVAVVAVGWSIGVATDSMPRPIERGAAVRALAAEFRVHPESIRRIAAGDTWRKAA